MTVCFIAPILFLLLAKFYALLMQALNSEWQVWDVFWDTV